uniref:Uncharacterized protein n=1 Tax=viral metagenome TaxID=1070528 RepID=A0A6C0LG86_9ZZZZ
MGNSFFGKVPANVIITDTAGLKCPPDIPPPSTIDMYKADTIASGFPVASMVKRKNKVPINSTKYFCILYI